MSTDPTEPARRRRLAPAERESAVRSAARALALRDGLHGLSLRSVAKEAGVTGALVAHYVPSMDALVADTFTDVAGEELTQLRERLAGKPPPVALDGLVDALLEPGRESVTGVWIDAWSLGRRSETLAAAARTQMAAWQDWVAGLVRAGIADGAYAAPDPAAAAYAIVAMIDGLAAHGLVRQGTPADRGATLRRAIAATLGRG